MNTKVANGLLGIVSLFAAGLANAATVQITPSTLAVNNGDIFSVTLGAVGMPDLFSGGLILDWDAGLELVTPDAGIASQIESNFDFGFASGSAAGPLNISMSFLFGGPISGDFTIAVLDFRAIQEGSQGIRVSPRPLDTFLSPTGSALNPQPTLLGANITVNANATVVPLPGAAWLFFSGVVGMVGIARRRKVQSV
jgi:hypothetical protein